MIQITHILSIFQFIDILQILNYLLYLNLDCPWHLTWFFDLFKISRFYIFPNLLFKDLKNMKSPKVFMKRQIDALFLNNINNYFIIASIILAINLIF
jgi:hypothetical protein